MSSCEPGAVVRGRVRGRIERHDIIPRTRRDGAGASGPVRDRENHDHPVDVTRPGGYSRPQLGAVRTCRGGAGGVWQRGLCYLAVARRGERGRKNRLSPRPARWKSARARRWQADGLLENVDRGAPDAIIGWPSTSFPNYGDDSPARGARIARRDDRACREYARKKQRREPGCPARNTPP